MLFHDKMNIQIISLCLFVLFILSLTHWPLVTPFGVTELDQHWMGCGSVGLSSMSLCDTQLRTLRGFMMSIRNVLEYCRVECKFGDQWVNKNLWPHTTPINTCSGFRFSIKTIFAGIEILIVNVRRSWDRHIFIMGIPILLRHHFHTETILTWIIFDPSMDM